MQPIRTLRFPTSATAAGVLQLCGELHKTGVIDEGAISPIKSAIANEPAHCAPRSVAKHTFLADFIRASISS